METYLQENFEVKSKNSSEEVLQNWRKLCGVVKNPKRRFRFTANLSKRGEAAAMRRTNQVLPNLFSFSFFMFCFHKERIRYMYYFHALFSSVFSPSNQYI